MLTLSVYNLHPVYKYARDITDMELRGRSGVYNPRDLIRVRLALGSWAIDFGNMYTDFNNAWTQFWVEYTSMGLLSKSKIRLSPQDLNNYTEALQELEGTKDAVSVLLTQLFSFDDTYVGSWISCTAEYERFFWVLINADWEAKIIENWDELQLAVMALSGKPGYNYRTFGYNKDDDCFEIIRGTKRF